MRKDKMLIRKLTINRIREDLQALLNDRLDEIPAGTVKEIWNAAFK